MLMLDRMFSLLFKITGEKLPTPERKTFISESKFCREWPIVPQIEYDFLGVTGIDRQLKSYSQEILYHIFIGANRVCFCGHALRCDPLPRTIQSVEHLREYENAWAD